MPVPLIVEGSTPCSSTARRTAGDMVWAAPGTSSVTVGAGASALAATAGAALAAVAPASMMAITAPQFFFAQERSIADEAYAGDVVGLPNHGTLRIGDTLTEGEALVFQGVPELLEALNGQGRTLYIATSKPWEFAREIARHFAFDHHFKVIYGSELDGTRTNKVELIRHLLDEEGLDPAQTLMIGDRKHDLIGARSNGLEAVAVERAARLWSEASSIGSSKASKARRSGDFWRSELSNILEKPIR